jgi:Cytochrome c7 and related cytochrome c
MFHSKDSCHKRMKAIRLHTILGVAVSLTACGGAPGRPLGPGAPSPSTAAEWPRANPSPSAAATAIASVPVPVPPTPSPEAILPSAVEMKPPVPSSFTSELEALGLTPKSLPPIEKLDPRALRGVMKLMAKALGVKCGDCHAEGDFAAPTARKRIAAHMWNEFAAKLEMDGGSPIFCDSCHQGRTNLLDRRDKKALGAWMDQNFVVKLQRKDGQAHECETCHVNMEMKLLAKWSEP